MCGSVVLCIFIISPYAKSDISKGKSSSKVKYNGIQICSLHILAQVVEKSYK